MIQALSLACDALFVGLMLYVCFDDARRYIIPNEVSLALLALSPVALLSGAVPAPWWSGLGAMAVMAIYTGIPYYMANIPSDRRPRIPAMLPLGGLVATLGSAVVFVGSAVRSGPVMAEGADGGMAVPPEAAMVALIVSALLFFVSVILWLASRGRLVYGGGDFKLSVSVAPWLGLASLPDFVVCTALMGGVLALVYLALRRLPVASPVRLWAPAVFRHGGIPYGIAIALGAVLAYFRWGPFLAPV